MNAVVVDTDVVSLIFKGDSRAEKYLSVLSGPDLLVSRLSGDQSEIVRFRAYMRRFVSVPSSRDLIVKWAELMVMARSQGRRIDVADAWVAATVRS
jgi:predicted nucleic acid-binding protein